MAVSYGVHCINFYFHHQSHFKNNYGRFVQLVALCLMEKWITCILFFEVIYFIEVCTYQPILYLMFCRRRPRNGMLTLWCTYSYIRLSFKYHLSKNCFHLFIYSYLRSTCIGCLIGCSLEYFLKEWTCITIKKT